MDWDSGNDANGRANHLTVTYIDADGKEQTQYFNYIYKDKAFNDGVGETSNIYADQNNFIEDLKKGIIYVSEVKQDTDGKWHYIDKYETAESHEKFGYLDNYQTLSQLAADQARAEAAVKAATDEVNNLKKQIVELGGDITGTRAEDPDDPTYLDSLYADLEEKEAILAENRAELNVLKDLRVEF